MDEYSDEQIEQWNKEDVFYPDEMFIAAENEESARVAKKFMENNKEQLQKIAELETLERQDRINGAMEELDAIVLGGQDTREFYLSILYIRSTLESLK